MKTKIICFLAAILIGSLSVWGAAPEEFNYQGKLTDAAGNPVNSNVARIRVRICDDAACTTPLWPAAGYETHDPVTVTNGVFSILIGSVLGAGNGLSGVLSGRR